MVIWTELASAFSTNPNKNENVKLLKIANWKSFPVERFPILVNKLTALPVLPPSPDVQLTSSPVLKIEEIPLPVPATPAVSKVSAPTPAAAAVAKSELPTMKTREYMQKPIDPIIVGIEQAEPLYNGSSNQTKLRIECEEAQRIEGMINDLYKSQGGRSRGWTKCGLENFIKPRCASGGNIYELDKAKKAFVWQLLLSDKVLSSALDFLCVAKRIRIAVWFETEKLVIVYPAADYNGVMDSTLTLPIYHITSQGSIRTGMKNAKDLVNFCKRMEYVLMPPYSVAHSLSTLTLDELESVGKKLGMAEVTGTKAERVAKIASYKLAQRLISE